MSNSILPLSGGLDSVAALYLCLTDRSLSAGSIRTLHVDMLHAANGRNAHEGIAVKSVLEYVKTKLGIHLFHHTCKFGYGKFPRDPDIVTVGFLTGMLLRGSEFKRFDTVVISEHLDDAAQGEAYHRRSRERCKIIQEVAGRPIQFLWPIKDYRKRDLLDLIPKELADLSWSCRNPTQDGQQCGKHCKPCIDKRKEAPCKVSKTKRGPIGRSKRIHHSSEL